MKRKPKKYIVGVFRSHTPGEPGTLVYPIGTAFYAADCQLAFVNGFVGLLAAQFAGKLPDGEYIAFDEWGPRK